MSWFKRLFGKCCDDTGSCCGEEKQEMSPIEETEEESPAPEEPMTGEETPVVE